MIRKSFDNDLLELKSKLNEMGELVQTAVKNACQALEKQDLSLAEQVIENDKFINDVEDEIEAFIVHIITTQQPIATDLRKIIATLKITASIERIGDFAVDISKATKRIGKQTFIKPLQELPLMLDIVQKMLKAGLDAYQVEDVDLAQDMARMDDHVDQMYATVVKDLFTKMIDNEDKMEQAIQLAYIARFVERMADHSTNIAEGVIYIVKGERVDLNQ